MKTTHSFAAAFVIFLVGACSSGEHSQRMQSATPGDQYLLTPAVLKSLEEKASMGDLQAAQKLILHYELASPDLGKAMHWQRVAADQGDAGAMLNLASYLAMEGQEETCREALKLISKARTSTSNSRLIARADRDLVLLKQGVNQDGPCVRWFKNARASD